MGSIGAMSAGSANRYFQKNFKDKSKFVPEGVEGRVEYKGNVSKIIFQLKGGLRSSMGYIGAKNLGQISSRVCGGGDERRANIWPRLTNQIIKRLVN